jgi:xanthine dehydrogenase/oxidase
MLASVIQLMVGYLMVFVPSHFLPFSHFPFSFIFISNTAPFKIGVKNNGTIMALSVEYYSNGGASYDATLGSMDMCQLWSDNVYYVPNSETQGFCCKTNLPPNTSMRAPGALQSIYMSEELIERVAAGLNMDPKAVSLNFPFLDLLVLVWFWFGFGFGFADQSFQSNQVREANFYQNGQQTPYLQTITNFTIPQVWSLLQTNANYAVRVLEVATFNSNNRWRKKGLEFYLF